MQAGSESREPQHNFSRAFERMASVVAIAETETAADTVKQLVLQCFLLLPNDKFEDGRQLAEVIQILFGLSIPEFEVNAALDELLAAGSLARPLGTNLVLSPALTGTLQAALSESEALERRVNETITRGIEEHRPDIDPSQVWLAFRDYLAQAFGQHGILTAALLRPSIEIGPEYRLSLSTMLDRAIAQNLPPQQREAVRDVIVRFLNSMDHSPDLATYIAQSANAAFSYFSLAVAPDTSADLRGQLKPMTLFLDTNFMFGILDLHINPQVEVSNALINEIQRHALPFKLRYHATTQRELTSTVQYYADRLRQQRWTQALSKAALTSPYLSGIEQRFHAARAKSGIDVETFLRPYEHVDELLRERGITIYRSSDARLEERATLLHEYDEFLTRIGKKKSYESLDHDVTVLDTVRQLRSNAESSLDAGALLLTCDYWLYRFDWEQSQAGGKQCVVLPSMFWQVLRPFVSSDPSFEKSFAATFALPEFRSIGNVAALEDATSRLLTILAGYSNLSEPTAIRLLANDLLLDRISSTSNARQVQEQVELAIAQDNEDLLEDNVALAKERDQLDQRQTEMERQQRERDERIADLEAVVQAQQLTIEESTKRQQALDAALNAQQLSASERAAKAATEEQARLEAQGRAFEESERRELAERNAQRNTLLACIASALALFALFELVVRAIPWTWLIRSPNSLGLQGCAALAVAILARSYFYPQWRKSSLAVGFTVLVVLISILGH